MSKIKLVKIINFTSVKFAKKDKKDRISGQPKSVYPIIIDLWRKERISNVFRQINILE